MPRLYTDRTAEQLDPESGKGPSFINLDVFNQILDMDDDEEAEDEEAFSEGIVGGFFDQAETTFASMEKALKEKNLEELSSLGHFLKGSSAALGIVAVQDACEKMQHYGHLRDEEENTDLKEEDALNRIEGLIKGCRKDYEQAKVWLTSLYTEGAFDKEGDQDQNEDEDEDEDK